MREDEGHRARVHEGHQDSPEVLHREEPEAVQGCRLQGSGDGHLPALRARGQDPRRQGDVHRTPPEQRSPLLPPLHRERNDCRRGRRPAGASASAGRQRSPQRRPSRRPRCRPEPQPERQRPCPPRAFRTLHGGCSSPRDPQAWPRRRRRRGRARHSCRRTGCFRSHTRGHLATEREHLAREHLARERGRRALGRRRRRCLFVRHCGRRLASERRRGRLVAEHPRLALGRGGQRVH
mmetsp:Transcript_25145/g.42981  ORF Transcript_25145/g.42981 Transcript_25145/m.42981 type:complete len:236 (-) Transcript_25145:435-1142(-)